MTNTYTYTVGFMSLAVVFFGAGCGMQTQVSVTSDIVVSTNTPAEVLESNSAEPVATSSGTLTVSPEQSVVEWYGHRRVGNNHTGSVMLKSGSVKLNEAGVLVSGQFVVDMTTIASYEKNERLDTHLKSDDFFAVVTHSEAQFVSTKVVPSSATEYMVTGSMTIKGITKEISFAATVTSEADGSLRGVAAIKVDRAAFDVRYGSESFFDNLGDKLIENEMELRLNLVATK